MSTSFVYPWGEVSTSIPVGSKLAVAVDGGKVEVYEVVGYPDIPKSETLLATVTNGFSLLGTYSAVKNVILRARETMARYEVGTAPTAASYASGVNLYYMTRQAASVAKTDTVTLTVANILTGYIAGTPTAAATYTLPTGAEMDTGLAAIDLSVDTAIDFSINNAATNASYTITLAAGATGWGTSIGNLIVSAYSAAAAASTARFRLRRTAADTWQIMRIA